MTTKTRDQLVNRAAQKLVLIGSGQSLESEDQEAIDGSVDAVLADLAARNIATVANDEEIPVAMFEHLAMCLAQTVAPDFGKPMDANAIAFAESRLRTINAASPTYEPQTATYY